MSDSRLVRRRRVSRSIAARSDWIGALLSVGYSWGEIASYFSGDEIFDGFTGRRFANEWSRLLKNGGGPDKDRVAALREEIFKQGLAPGRFLVVPGSAVSESVVSRGEPACGVKNTESAPVVSAAAPGRLTGTKAAPVVRQEGSVVERHQMSAAAAGVSSRFPTRADGGVPGASAGEWVASGEPVELSQGSRAELERLMGRGMGMLRSEHFSAYFEFPSDMAAIAPAKVLRQQLLHPTTDDLIGALIFSFGGTERFRGHLARLPGAEKWIGFFEEKMSFQKALEKSRGLSADNKKEG